MIRLQKFLADCEICSRRKAEQYILDGRVTVNGEKVFKLGTKISPQNDVVLFDNKKIYKTEKFIYIMFNKPKACVTSSNGQFGRKTVFDYIKNIETRVFPIGRLDYNTSGLLLFTNDGSLTFKITHPKHKIEKIYIAKIIGIPNKQSIKKI